MNFKMKIKSYPINEREIRLLIKNPPIALNILRSDKSSISLKISTIKF